MTTENVMTIRSGRCKTRDMHGKTGSSALAAHDPRPGRGVRASEELRELPVDLIDAHDGQPRRTVNPRGLEELTQSIRDHGVLQPIRVRARGGRYEAIAGHRRLAAATRAGLETIPAVVVEADDGQALIEALIENVQREDLNAVERGEALRRLRVNLGARSWEAVGRAIGISRRHVYHLLNVSRLPEPFREDIQAGTVSEKHGRALLRLNEHPELQARLWKSIVGEHLSGDDALRVARDMWRERHGGEPGEPARSRPSVSLADVQVALQATLRLLPEAAMREIRPLRAELDELARCLETILCEPVPSYEAEGVEPLDRRPLLRPGWERGTQVARASRGGR